MDGEFDGEIIIEDGGAGGGDEAGGSGEHDAGDGASDQRDDQGGDRGDRGGDDQDRGEEDGERRGDREDDEGRDRGRRTDPAALRKALREIATQNAEFSKKFPRLEKELTGALFAREQMGKFGGVEAITDAMEVVEQFGGREAIEEMSSDLEAAESLERGMQSGDPRVLDGWAKDFPNGFKRIVLPAINHLEKIDDALFEQVGSHVVSKIFEKFGAFSAVTALGEAINGMKADDPKRPDAVKHYNALVNFLSQVKSLAGKAGQDPYAREREDVDRERQDLQTQTAKIFRQGVAADVNTEVSRELNRQLRAELASRKIFRVNANTADRMRKEINRELQRLVNTDPQHQRRYTPIMESGDRRRAANFIIAAAMKRLPKAISMVVSDYNLKPTGGGRTRRVAREDRDGAGNRGGSNNNSYSGRPQTSEVDFSRTDKATWLATKHTHGQAWMKNGRLAKW